MTSPVDLSCFSQLCARVAAQIQAVMDAPFVARLKGMILRKESDEPRQFERSAALAWLKRAAPARQPAGVSCVPLARRPSPFECDLTSRLQEWSALAKPSAAQKAQWAKNHAEACGELASAMGLSM
jgi:hypothetical protein